MVFEELHTLDESNIEWNTEINTALHLSCEIGEMDFIQQYTNDIIKLENMRSNDNYALKTACKQGHLEIVAFLVENFQLTIDDARSDNNYALRNACFFGHFEIVKLLVDHFGLTVDDIRCINNYAIHASCSLEHFEIVQWLVDKFDLKIEDFLCNKNWVLDYVKYTELGSWVLQKFDLQDDYFDSLDGNSLNNDDNLCIDNSLNDNLYTLVILYKKAKENAIYVQLESELPKLVCNDGGVGEVIPIITNDETNVEISIRHLEMEIFENLLMQYNKELTADT